MIYYYLSVMDSIIENICKYLNKQDIYEMLCTSEYTFSMIRWIFYDKVGIAIKENINIPDIIKNDIIRGINVSSLQDITDYISLKKITIGKDFTGELENIDKLPYLQILELEENFQGSLELIPKIRSIKKIKLKAPSNIIFNIKKCIYNNSLDPLKHAKSIDKVVIDRNYHDNFNFLEDMGQLKVLRLGCNRYLDSDHIKNLTNLEKLSCSINAKYNDLTFLERFTKLTHLYLRLEADVSLHFLKKLHNITNIRLNYSKGTINSHIFSNMKNLNSLILLCDNISNIGCLNKLKKLCRLDISVRNFNEPIRNFNRLKDLCIRSNRFNQQITNLPKLTNLWLSCDSFNSPIRDLPYLDDLTILSDRFNQDITNLTSLTTICISSNITGYIPSNSYVINVDISEYETCKLPYSIKKAYIMIYIREPPLQPSYTMTDRCIDGLTRLEDLVISKQEKVNMRLEHIHKLSNLKKLDIYIKNQDDIKQLSRLSKLEYLQIGLPPVLTLDPIANLPITHLHINSAQFMRTQSLDLTILTNMKVNELILETENIVILPKIFIRNVSWIHCSDLNLLKNISCDTLILDIKTNKYNPKSLLCNDSLKILNSINIKKCLTIQKEYKGIIEDIIENKDINIIFN